jgi:signal transduction histidine kinase/DNA-binding NarL/FixJ family response regulator
VNYRINGKVMEDTRKKILLIEDDKLDQMAFMRFVKDEKLPYDCTVAASVSQAQNILASEQFDSIVADYSLGDGTALDILDSVKDIPIIVVTGSGDEEVAIRAWKGGAYDYITKDFERIYLRSIPRTIENAINCKEMREALDRKQKNLEAIFDATPVGMLLVDGNMKVTRVNNTIKQIVKKEYQQIINRQIGGALCCINSISNENVKDYIYSPACKDCLLPKSIKAVFDSGQSVRNVEIHTTLKVDNKEIMPWFRMSAEQVIINGCRHVIVALSDITEQKKAEDKVNKMIAAKSGFISTVAHELRTSLAAMKEGVAIVFDGMAGRLNNKQKKYLNIAIRNAERLGALINDVLDFQKFEADRMTLDIQNNDIKEVVSEVHETMALYAKKNEVELILEIAEDLSVAKFDRAKVNQVLTNLVSNAVKFTPENGRVSINVQRQNEELVIRISDTGIGIPKEALPKIFECFYRVNQRDKEIQGTGLGLAIVHKIVMMHSGRIEVASEVGQGTTFTVFLPLDLKPMQKPLPAKADEILNNSIAH